MVTLSRSIVKNSTVIETELLLCCCHTYINFQTAQRIKTLVQEDINWADLILTARQQRVIPLLYWNLNEICPKSVPLPVLSQLRQLFHANAQSNLFLTGELLKLLKLFADYQISVIPFKGPVLATSAYGNLSLRQFCDLDILVDKQDYKRAKNLLISQGYQLHREWSWECSFGRENSRVSIDLHQGITPRNFPDPIDFESLWQRLEHNTVAGTTVPHLAIEDLLLILCVQWGKDCCEQRSRLSQLCDVAELICNHPDLNWVRLQKQARMTGSERMLLLDLYLVHELLKIELPQQILQKIQADTAIKLLAKKVRERLFCEVESAENIEKNFWSRWLYHQRFHFQLRERWQDKIAYFPYRLSLAFNRVMAPNKHDGEFLSLPNYLHFLYYLLRPVRLVNKFILNLGK